MNLSSFDSHTYIKKLTTAGFTEKQAEAQINLHYDLMAGWALETFTTKQDLLDTQHHLEIKFFEFREAMKAETATFKVDIKEEMVTFKIEMKAEMVNFKIEMKEEMFAFKGEIKEAMTASNQEVKGEIISLVKRITLLEGKMSQLHWLLTGLFGGVMSIAIKVWM